MAFDLAKLVAEPMYAPLENQSAAPAEVWGHRPPVARSDELTRILNLPRRALELDGTERATAIVDMVSERYSTGATTCECARIDPERHAAEGCINRLRLVQALALREIGIVGGMLGPIGVGHGKTLIDLLAALALAPLGIKLAVLLIPPGLVVQLISDYEYIGQHFKMPSLVVQGSDYTRVCPGMPLLQVMPYSRLQQPGATQWLELVKPDAIIADECHKLRSMGQDTESATAARVRRFLEDHDARFCAWSGSVTSKSIKDYAALIKYALRNGSPLPRNDEDVDDWARAIDPSPNPADPGPLLQGLIDTGCCLPGESLHTGIRRRISETVGVVSTTAPAVDCELVIEERAAPKVPREIRDHIVRALAFVRPDGEELVTAMQAVACAITLAFGFHYRWIYPKHVFPRDTMLILEWLDVRKAWHQELRAKLQRREEHLDSPQLVTHAAERHHGARPQHRGLPTWASRMYPAWREIKDRVQYESEAVRLDDFLVRDAVQWANDHTGIIWYEHAPVGEWIAELAGIPLYGGGAEAAKGIVKESGRPILASIKAHGTGRNGLQFNYADQLAICGASDAALWEQLWGRTHRAGQRAARVRGDIYLHTAELRKHVKAALRRALYVEGTTMQGVQKLVMGFPWDPSEDDEE